MKTIKHNGEVIGHVWKDPQGYVSKHIKTGDKYDGNDKESVVHALINRHNDLKQGVAKGVIQPSGNDKTCITN